MLRAHKTRDGQHMFISQMEDDHLVSTISLIIRNIRACKDALSSKISINPFKSALYGVDMNLIAEEAKGRIKRLADSLYPYLAEAMLRKMDFSKELQEIFDRSGKESRFGIEDDSRQLLSNYEEDDDE